MTDKDQSREAFEAWLIQDRRSRNKALHEWTDEELKGVLLHGSDREWAAWQAARSAPAAPVELPEPIGVVRVFEPHEGAGKICSEASTDITRLPIGRSLLYTEQQVRELLSQAGTVLPETPESPPKSAETRMDASSDRGGGVLPAGWVAVPVEPTEDMHVAACKVLQRANGLDGTPKRMLDAMLAAAPKLESVDKTPDLQEPQVDKTTNLQEPKLPQGDGCWCQTCQPLTLDDMRMVLCPDCGNKRCPRATHHDNACTNSNEPGQPGSSWEHVKPPKEQG